MSLLADLRIDRQSANPSEMHPLVKDKLMRPRTVFHPGSRIKMNILPMILNLFVPWGIFTFVCGICSSWVMYNQPGVVYMMLAITYLGWGMCLRKAAEARKDNPEPTWFTYVSLAVGIAVIAGTVCGMTLFQMYRRPFFQIRDLKVVRDLDAGKEYGQNWMDAGILEFKQGSRLDGLRTWHFKHGSLYCVAPIVVDDSKPETQSYDFWAVGQDCCSLSSSDFRCGAWAQPGVRKAIRIVDDEASPFFRLAVKQAETLYGIVASHPIFFEWSYDPEAEVAGWNRKAFSNYIFMVCVAFVCSLFLLAMATCNFAFIGRSGRMEMFDDPYWNADVYKSTQMDPAMAGMVDPATGMVMDPRTGMPMDPSMQRYL